MINRINSLIPKFEEIYGAKPQIIANGPGRVDLLGSHTDYNEGFVLGIALNLGVISMGYLTDDRKASIYSSNFDSISEFDLNNIEKDSDNSWSNYVRGVILYLQEIGVDIPGIRMLIDGNIPIGTGLSSSAAIEMATGVLIQELSGKMIDGTQLALIGQKAENCFVGVNTGIMDQFISRMGGKNYAVWLDCRTLDYELLPIDNTLYKIVVCDTMKRRGLVDSEYNTRRKQCEESVELFSTLIPNVKALRDVSPEDFEKYKDQLPEINRKRAEHVIFENFRVMETKKALHNNDIVELGNLMCMSHISARDLYEISCPELDAMYNSIMSAPGCLGGRMAGAGFGGCVVCVVKSESIEGFASYVKKHYFENTNLKPEIYVCTAENGASKIVMD